MGTILKTIINNDKHMINKNKDKQNSFTKKYVIKSHNLCLIITKFSENNFEFKYDFFLYLYCKFI